jgi:hypothetical protein
LSVFGNDTTVSRIVDTVDRDPVDLLYVTTATLSLDSLLTTKFSYGFSLVPLIASTS